MLLKVYSIAIKYESLFHRDFIKITFDSKKNAGKTNCSIYWHIKVNLRTATSTKPFPNLYNVFYNHVFYKHVFYNHVFYSHVFYNHVFYWKKSKWMPKSFTWKVGTKSPLYFLQEQKKNYYSI